MIKQVTQMWIWNLQKFNNSTKTKGELGDKRPDEIRWNYPKKEKNKVQSKQNEAERSALAHTHKILEQHTHTMKWVEWRRKKMQQIGETLNSDYGYSINIEWWNCLEEQMFS